MHGIDIFLHQRTKYNEKGRSLQNYNEKEYVMRSAIPIGKWITACSICAINIFDAQFEKVGT